MTDVQLFVTELLFLYKSAYSSPLFSILSISNVYALCFILFFIANNADQQNFFPRLFIYCEWFRTFCYFFCCHVGCIGFTGQARDSRPSVCVYVDMGHFLLIKGDIKLKAQLWHIKLIYVARIITQFNFETNKYIKIFYGLTF